MNIVYNLKRATFNETYIRNMCILCIKVFTECMLDESPLQDFHPCLDAALGEIVSKYL